MTRPAQAGRTIGIDLGTDTSAVAAMGNAGEPIIIPGSAAGVAIRSLVSLVDGPGGEPEMLAGARAERAANRGEERLRLRGFKQLMGRRFDDPEVERLAPWLPYALAAAPNGDAWLTARGLALSPPELSALVLRELRLAAESYLDEPIAEAVIAVPA
ncbi:MAG TPA: Hsp70 family protein, partial [Kofleriaceae bacterium]|nr:Hsp70 family protein [Kofleriaceae bacterium]